MTDAPDALQLLAADIADLHMYVSGDASATLEPEHFTTRGYEQAIAAAAAARRTA